MFCISKQSPSLVALHIHRAQQDTIRYETILRLRNIETERLFPFLFDCDCETCLDMPSNNDLETPPLWIPHRPVSDRQWAAIHLYVISKMFAWNKAEKWKWSLTGAGRATSEREGDKERERERGVYCIHIACYIYEKLKNKIKSKIITMHLQTRVESSLFRMP